MPTIELPEFGTAQTNENEPTDSLKSTGWANGDQPPASVVNWLHRTTYDTVRATLGRTVAGSVAQGFQIGATISTGGAVDFFEQDAGIIVASEDSPNIRTSTDGGLTFATVATPTNIGTGIAIVPGSYAVCATNTTVFHHAPYPYSTWTTDVAVTNTFGDFEGYAIATVSGLGSLLIILRNGVLHYTDATTEPTVSGDWTTSDISSVTGAGTTGIAVSDTHIVVGSATGVYYAALSAGIAAGDFTAVTGPTASSAVAYNGTRFVSYESVGETMIRTAAGDASGTWVSTFFVSPGTSASVQSITADTDTGIMLLAYNGTADYLYMSTDGAHWYQLVTLTSVIDVTRGNAPRIFKSDYSVIGMKSTQDDFAKTL